MASLFKKPSGTYYLSFFSSDRRPQRKQVSLRTSTRRTAEVLQRRLEDAWTLGDYDPWVEADWTAGPRESEGLALLGNARDAFLRSRSHLRPLTIERYRHVLGPLVLSVGADLPTAALTAGHVSDHLGSTRTRAVTRRSYAGSISAFCNWLVARGALARNPVPDLSLERPPQKHPRYLSTSDVDALCREIAADGARAFKRGQAGLWLLPVVRANVYLGLRASELCHLRWDHVDLASKTLVVANTDGFTTKSARERTLPLARPVVDVLGGLGQDGDWVFTSATGLQLQRQYLSRAFKRYVRAAGLPEHVNFHTTRHTAASWLAERGAPVEAIRMYLGHSSVAVTERYMHLSPSSLAAQVSAAFDRVEEGASSPEAPRRL